ncbi:unnamed protein product [Prorocentrum cordatum]|uniref:Uncharacterized protein n=1 Tax=Prorocentrum cordatum TaxID=2364126 RepID=A0ABN9XM42_9DINO|nr:unnamed protein product [Polarella glacialis]
MGDDFPDLTGYDDDRLREFCAGRQLPLQFVKQFVQTQRQIFEAADELATIKKRPLEGALAEHDQHRMGELIAQQTAARATERLRRAKDAVGVHLKDLFKAAVQQMPMAGL